MGMVFAAIREQHFGKDATLTGVAPDGVDSGETWERGRLRKWADCTVGGLFLLEQAATMHESQSGMLRQIAWNLDGMTSVVFSWRDPDGIWVPFAEPTADIGLLDLQQTMLFQPWGALQITASGKAKKDAAIVTWWEAGRYCDMFTSLPTLGAMALP